MASFLDKCEEYFESRDFYAILKVERDATLKIIKKAYYKLSLLVHPDRVEEKFKLEATEKFKVLAKIHSILQDENKRKLYDENGDFDEEDDCDTVASWMTYWRSMFKRITTEDIQNYEKEYKGSDVELRDIKKAYVSSNGNMDKILEMVPFSNCDNEPRIIAIVRKMVDDGEVEEFSQFFNEPARKKTRRRRRYDAERAETESLNVNDSELEQAMRKTREEREKRFEDFFKRVEETCKADSKRKKSIKGSETAPAKKRTLRSRK